SKEIEGFAKGESDNVSTNLRWINVIIKKCYKEKRR
uniref:Uncharacterized protein n=1 Tax=Anopheles atroparvus TaxID=41427 RepID=A0AAG5DWS5_ANOAO